MNKKILAAVFAVVAVAACAVLLLVTNNYRETRFYLLGEGAGNYTPTELLFTPDSQTGAAMYVSQSGRLENTQRLSWDVAFEEGTRSVTYYLYAGTIFPLGEEYVNFYAANTSSTFLALSGEKKYFVDINANQVRPLFEGSTYFDPYGVGIDGISTDGGYAAGITDSTLTILTLQKGSFSPTDKRTVDLKAKGIENAVFLRYINNIHLWLSGEQNGVSCTFLCDSSTGEIAQCSAVPEGFSEKRHSRIWHFGSPQLQEEEKLLTVSFFHALNGTTLTASLPADQYSDLAPVAISPGGTYAVLRLTQENKEVYGVYKFANGSLTLFEDQPEQVHFASEQVLFLNGKDSYRALRIVH